MLAALLGLFAMAKFKKIQPPERTIASTKQTAAVLQGVKPHPRVAVVASYDTPGAVEAGQVERTPARQM